MMIWIQGIATAVAVAVTMAHILNTDENPDKQPPMCDSCRHLMKKNKKSAFGYIYECSIRDHGLFDDRNLFDKPPEFCRNYTPRDGGHQK